MKRILTLLLLVFIALTAADTAFAASYPSMVVSLYKCQNSDDSSRNKDLPPKGRRTPPLPIYMTISEDFVLNFSIDIEEILVYEVWNEENSEFISDFIDESEFVTYIFNNPGKYQIHIITNDYTYIGELSTR